jgi:large subunit ribosomal protein L11
MIKIKALVEGGKAKPAPPLGPSLAQAKVNVNEVISKINEKTKDFEGIQVPVEIEIDPETKKFKIKVGTPPVSSLVKRELKVSKLAKAPFNIYEKEDVKEEFKESLSFEQVIKIAKAKLEDLKTDDLKKAVKQVIGSCVSLGVYIEGKKPKEIMKEVDEGKWDEKIK